MTAPQGGLGGLATPCLDQFSNLSKFNEKMLGLGKNLHFKQDFEMCLATKSCCNSKMWHTKSPQSVMAGATPYRQYGVDVIMEL